MRDLAAALVLDGFAATVSYRLEPEGRGSRFPLVLGHLLRGRLTAGQCAPALVELEQIAAGLRGLPRDKAVWSLDDLRRRDDSGYPVDHRAASLYEYFRADDGQPLLEALRQAVLAAQASGKRVLITSPRRAFAILLGMLTILVGGAWVVLVHELMPRALFVPGPAGLGGRSGFLIWPQGAVPIVVGVWRLLGALYPALHEFGRRRAGLLYLAGGGAWGLLIWLTWRG